jgi:hypothetical protein
MCVLKQHKCVVLEVQYGSHPAKIKAVFLSGGSGENPFPAHLGVDKVSSRTYRKEVPVFSLVVNKGSHLLGATTFLDPGTLAAEPSQGISLAYHFLLSSTYYF